jgi:hypothetical protein
LSTPVFWPAIGGVVAPIGRSSIGGLKSVSPGWGFMSGFCWNCVPRRTGWGSLRGGDDIVASELLLLGFASFVLDVEA